MSGKEQGVTLFEIGDLKPVTGDEQYEVRSVLQ